MATGTNGIATVNDLVTGKGLYSPPNYSSNQCPTRQIIVSSMGGAVSATYSSDQLVKYSDVSANSRSFIVYNWGFYPIYTIQFTLENTSSLAKEIITLEGQTMAAGGGSAYNNHGISIINSGTGTIRVIQPIVINGGSKYGSINLSAVTILANGTKPTTWNNSLGASNLVSGTYKLKIDLNFP